MRRAKCGDRGRKAVKSGDSIPIAAFWRIGIVSPYLAMSLTSYEPL